MNRLLVVTDAWRPQVNGVVRSLERIGQEMSARGYRVHFLTPDRFWTVPMPTYPEIRLSLATFGDVGMHIAALAPDFIHIATEGPLGLAARRYCVVNGLAFSTSYHTRFPEYLSARLPVPEEWSYAYLRWFHAAAATTMVPTPRVLKDLRRRGFRHLALWSRGVDAVRFSPGPRDMFAHLPRPHLLYVGRVAVEKNVSAFLDLEVPGSKIVVGDGPQLHELQRCHQHVTFTGGLSGDALVSAYRGADVMVFPSLTDTFGNVMTEAMACGTPVAAYPVMGPLDVLTDPRAGAMDMDLDAAVMRALTLSRDDARTHALGFTWETSVGQFMANIRPAHAQVARAA